MATIKPFIALRPCPDWFESVQHKLGGLQGLLEGNKAAEPTHAVMQKNLGALKKLLKGGNYHPSDTPSMFVYEQETFHGSQFGVWTMSSLEDLHNGEILRHEHTITESQQRLTLYRKLVGLEGSPVLLTYPRDTVINRLIEHVASRPPLLTYKLDQMNHRIWDISEPAELERFRSAFQAIPRVFVADGHHRLAAAAALGRRKSQWITSLYVSSGQLRCNPFHRAILPAKAITKKALLNIINQYFFIAEVPGNVPFKPQKEGRLGLFHLGYWYQLDSRQTESDPALQADASFLQSMILAPFFGITDPRKDKQLYCVADQNWSEILTLIEQNQKAIVFTLAAISPDQLMHLASKKVILPPKSTYMEPKIPYGLLMHHNLEGVTHA